MRNLAVICVLLSTSTSFAEELTGYPKNVMECLKSSKMEGPLDLKDAKGKNNIEVARLRFHTNSLTFWACIGQLNEKANAEFYDCEALGKCAAFGKK